MKADKLKGWRKTLISCNSVQLKMQMHPGSYQINRYQTDLRFYTKFVKLTMFFFLAKICSIIQIFIIEKR